MALAAYGRIITGYRSFRGVERCSKLGTDPIHPGSYGSRRHAEREQDCMAQ
jgi:hypothetical protein